MLDQIIAYPDDDTLRLAHAVELRGQGDPQGDFIVLQVERINREIAEKRPLGRPSGQEVLLRRENAHVWGADVAPLVRSYGFHRGLVGLINLSPADFIEHADQLFEMAPIQHADINDGNDPSLMAEVLKSPHLAKLRSVSFAKNGIDDEMCERLARCEYLRNARWVQLTDNHIGLDGVMALASTSVFDDAVILDLLNNPCNPIEQPGLDWDGSIQSVELPPEGRQVVAKYGSKRWLRFPWRSLGHVPDRFHV